MSQFARPAQDISVGSMTGNPINTAGNLYQNIDESAASDSDYVYSANNANTTFETKLGVVADPNVDTGHILRYRIARTNAGTLSSTGSTSSVTAGLYQGATEIASDAQTSPSGVFSTMTFNLSSAQAAAITDYSDLRIRFTIVGGGGSPSNRRGIGISFAELEVPNYVPPAYNGSFFPFL